MEETGHSNTELFVCKYQPLGKQELRRHKEGVE